MGEDLSMKPTKGLDGNAVPTKHCTCPVPVGSRRLCTFLIPLLSPFSEKKTHNTIQLFAWFLFIRFVCMFSFIAPQFLCSFFIDFIRILSIEQ